jgi:hypothetical protein
MPNVAADSSDRNVPAVSGLNNAGGDGIVGHGTVRPWERRFGTKKPQSGRGVAGFSDTWQGVYGHSEDNAGVVGESQNFVGVWGDSHHRDHPGVLGRNSGGGPAALFDGDVRVTGDVELTGSDVAEQFEVGDEIEVQPGTVMVLDDVDRVRVSDTAYDRRVAGVVSGGGEWRPAVVLGHGGRLDSRLPLALVGKVLCKVDASFAPVETGDLLTTSPTPGHAMKATAADRLLGAVLGKAMAPLAHGKGLVPILVSLH